MPEPKPVEVAVPQAVANMRLFDHVDYEDAYLVDTAVRRTPEQWMRAFIGDAPRWFQLPWVGVGTILLGAKFGSLRSPDTVLGWKVLDDRPDRFVVGLDSVGGLFARLVALSPPGHALIVTQIRLHSAYARALWPPIRRGHRFFAPYLLGRAAERAVCLAEGR